jgi:carboxyl-terminal processing protease
VAIRVFSRAVPAAVHTGIALLREQGLTRLVFDLRGNPGGELPSALEVLRDLLPAGALVATLVDPDGDPIEYRARGDAYPWPAVVRVDEHTASAAELFAGSLQAHGRARVVGRRTYGKSAARMVIAGTFVEAGRFVLPDGVDVQGVGVQPDAPDLPEHVG